MKYYTIKNYRGNLLESLKKFQESHAGVKIVETFDQGDLLAIAAEEPAAPSDPNVSDPTKAPLPSPEVQTDPIIDFGCKLMIFGVKAHLWHLNTRNNAAHLALKDLYEACDDAADKLLEAEIGGTGDSIARFDFDIRDANLEFPGDGSAIAQIIAIRDEAAGLPSNSNRGIDSVIDDFCATCNSVIYKLTRLS